MCNCDPKEPPAVVGLTKKRGCTDILFLLAFIASWAAIIVIITSASDAGADPQRIIRGVDYYGRVCGKSAGVEHLALAAWPNPQYYSYQICVDSCNVTSNPHTSEMAILYPSIEFLYYCVPNPAVYLNVNISISASFGDSAVVAQRAFADLLTTWVLILISPVIALVVSFAVVALLRRFAGWLVVVCIALVLFGCVALGAVFVSVSNDAAAIDPTSTRTRALRICAGICFGVAGIFFVIMVAMRTRIRIAVKVVEVAAGAINDMKSLLFFPLGPFLVACGYFAFWIFVAVYLFSVSNSASSPIPMGVRQKQLLSPFVLWEDDVYRDAAATALIDGGLSCVTPTCIQKYMPLTSYAGATVPVNGSSFEFDERWRAVLAYHFFHLLWNMQFLFYLGYLIFAGAAADWYFSETAANGEDKKVGLAPVSRSCYRSLRYHIGTVALTSLIIATIQFIRAVVLYIQKKTATNPPNQLQRCVFCLIQCCLKCVECCMDKINKNALIWTAIYGDGFVIAACSSFALIWRNLMRVAAVSMVSSLVLTIAKVAIAAATAGIAVLVINNHSSYVDTVSSPILPTVIIGVLAFTVGSGFMIVFQSVIDTIFFCFLVDEDANKSSHQMRAPKRLREIVDEHQRESTEKFHDLQRERARRGGDVAVAPSPASRDSVASSGGHAAPAHAVPMTSPAASSPAGSAGGARGSTGGAGAAGPSPAAHTPVYPVIHH